MKISKAIFGPAGNSESFSQRGFKSNLDIPAYLENFGLGAYEYQCGRGVKITQESAKKFGEKAREYGITLSLHAPYYISLSSAEKEKREKSVDYILQSAAAAKAMGAKRIVVHSGSCGKMSREEALALAGETLKAALAAMDENGFSEIFLCPETMGKTNQLGSLDEVLSLCQMDRRLIPCIDFGHLNARTMGGLKTKEDYKKILNAIKEKLGEDRLYNFHSHFSKIEYTNPGGEKRHLTFEDTLFGPDFKPLAELFAEMDIAPTVICESAGTQAEDAAFMQKIYLSEKNGLE